jgi:hypothetical protein
MEGIVTVCSYLQAEGEMNKTWKFTQKDLAKELNEQNQRKVRVCQILHPFF